MLKKASGRATGLIIGNTIVGALLGFVALKVFAVNTGTHADVLLGQLAFALGIAGVLSVGLDMGLGLAHVKRVSEGRLDLPTLVGSYAFAKVALAIGYLALLATGAIVASAAGVLQDTPRFALLFIALYFAFLGLRAIFTGTFDGRKEFSKTQLAQLAENLARVPLIIVFAVLFAGAVRGAGPLAGWLRDGGAALAPLLRDHGADLLAGIYAASALASLLVAALLFRRGYLVGTPERGVLQDYWGYARHVFVATAVGLLYVNVDRVVITAFWDASNTGQYYGAQRFSELIGMVPLALYTVLFPTLSGIYARGDKAQARAAVATSVRHVSLLVVPLAAFAVALPGPLLALVLTGHFAQAVPTLQLLALFAFVYAVMYPYHTCLYAVDRPDVTARAALLGTGLNVVLNLVLVPPTGTFGLPLPGLAERGAALATLLAVGVQFLYLRAAVHRIEGPVQVRRHVGKHLVGGAVMVALLVAFAPPPDAASWWLMVGLLLLGGLAYLAVLALLREFTRDDLELYLHVLDPAAMARHIRADVTGQGPHAKGRDPPSRPPEEPGG